MASTEEIAALQLRIEANINRLDSQLKRANDKMNGTARRMSKTARSLDATLSQVGGAFGLRISAGAIGAAGALALLGKAATDVVRNGDRLKLLEGRLTAVTGSAERGAEAFQSVFEVSQRLGVAVDQVGLSFAQFRLAADSLGATDAEVAGLVETVLQLGRVSGASQQSLDAGARQLGQALASGVLRGDELNSVLENIPEVARLIAKDLGLSIGQLREMAQQGEVTAEKVFGALQRGSDEAKRRFEQLPPTIAQASTKLANSWAVFTAEIDKSVGASETLVDLLDRANKLLDQYNRTPQEPFPFGPNAAPGAGVGSLIGGQIRQDVVRRETALRSAEGPTRRPTLGGGNAPLRVPGPPKRRPDDASIADLGEPPLKPGGRGGASADDVIRLLDAERKRVDLLREEIALVGQSEAVRARYLADQEAQRVLSDAIAAAKREGRTLTAAERAEVENLAAAQAALNLQLFEAGEAYEAQQRAAEDARRAALDLARDQRQALDAVGDAFASSLAQAKNLGDFLDTLKAKFADIAINALFGQGPAGGAFNNLIGSAGAGVLGLLLSAKGNVFSGGRVQAFAKGGIVGGPTTFPMRGGGVGLMGEAGPEAIMPLKRGRGGRLGIEASGGGGGGPMVYAPQITVVSPNADPRQVAAVVDARMRQQLPAFQQAISQRGIRS